MSEQAGRWHWAQVEVGMSNPELCCCCTDGNHQFTDATPDDLNGLEARLQQAEAERDRLQALLDRIAGFIDVQPRRRSETLRVIANIAAQQAEQG